MGSYDFNTKIQREAREVLLATTLEMLKSWFKEGQDLGATHMLVICDTFEYEDYPVYVGKGRDPKEVLNNKCKPDNMQKLMECYALHKGFDEQERRGRFAMDFSKAGAT